MVTSSILRAHISQVQSAGGSHQFGIYHEGGAPEIAWKIHAKMAAELTTVYIACDIRNGFVAVRRSDAVEEARRWCPMLGTVFANLLAGGAKTQPTAWANTPGGSRPITVRDGFQQDVRRDEATRVGFTDELEYWALVDDDITIATTAELATFVMNKLGLELRNEKCAPYCPIPERRDHIREEMTQRVKWTPDGLMIMGTAIDGEYRTTAARKNHGKLRESRQTGSDECAKLTWTADALLLPGNWLPLF